MKKLWMDLELRKDIDDYLTLVYALENDYKVSVLSINNPSINELLLVNYTIKKFNYDIPIVITGIITEYEEGSDIHNSLMPLINDCIDKSFCSIKDIENIKNQPYLFFCGGSLTTLSELIDINKDVDAFIQGGFASFELVGAENTLKKFKKRKKVPSWNLNLDLKATELVLNSNIKMKFISKNICHNSFISVSDLNDCKSFFNDVAIAYFENNIYKDKCMHDLMAFLTIYHDFVTFKRINLLRTDDEIVKWWSEENELSNIKISTKCNFELFKKLI